MHLVQQVQVDVAHFLGGAGNVAAAVTLVAAVGKAFGSGDVAARAGVGVTNDEGLLKGRILLDVHTGSVEQLILGDDNTGDGFAILYATIN